MRRRSSNIRLPHFFKDLMAYCPEEVAKIDEEDGENAVIYGLPCFKIEKGYPYEGFIFLSDSQSDYIGFSNQYYDSIEKLSIKNIKEITFKDKSENLEGYQKKHPEEIYFQILIGQKFYDFCMFSKRELLLIVKGILSIFQKKEIIYDKTMDGQLTQMVNKYDINFDKVFDYEEFQSLAKTLGVTPKLLMLDIDANHDGVVSEDEVIQYIKDKTSGTQVLKIFNQYAKKKKNSDTVTISPLNLQKFFAEIQEEPITELEAYQLVIFNITGLDQQIRRKINKKIQNSYIANNYKINKEEIKKIITNVRNKYKIKQEINVELNLREFYHMLNSHELAVYKTEKMRQRVDLDKPLSDYFINSTHNTYITGNQLSSYSSIKMYSLSLLEGYRLVELDCYNGPGDDIIITHGYTLVTKLKLDDILHELRNTAFIKSKMPVILSVENHLDEYHQNVMTQRFKEILKDLYIFPSDNKPDHLPTLGELQNKFIIKCGGTRLYERDEIKRAPIATKSNLRGRRNEKLKKCIIFDRFMDVEDSDDESNKNKIVEENEDDNNEINLDKFFKNDLDDVNKAKDIKKNFQQMRELFSKAKLMFKREKTEKEKEVEIIPNLEKLRGLLGTKFKYEQIEDKKYKPWECLTLKCTKFLNYHINPFERNEIIKLSQHCVLKAYPDSFSSANYDIIKCWRCGCQAAAINIQALEDDFTLFNIVFFYQNRKCGYVLKPSKLLNPNPIIDNAKTFYFLKMKIISCYNLMKLIEMNEEIIYEKKKLQIEIYSLGSEHDDKNPHHYYELNGGLIFPVIKGNDVTYDIPIYEDELGGIMIKITYEGRLIGRGCIPYCLMKNGIRRIPIFDNDCFICDGTFVLGHFQKKRRKASVY